MKPHHKPKNVTLTKISRLSKGNGGFGSCVPDSAADLEIKGQHQGFEVSQRALERIRAGLV